MPEQSIKKGPTEETEEYDKKRRERLKQSAQEAGYAQQEEQPEEEPEQEQTAESQEEQTQTQQTEDETDVNDYSKEELEQILNNQFDGDPLKAIKSWRSTQSYAAKKRQEAEEAKQIVDELNSVIEEKPEVGEIIEKAYNGEDVQSYFENNQESTQDKPESSSNDSKLPSEDKLDYNVDEETLAEAGYLDTSQKDSYTPTQWENLRRQAKLQYLEEELPNKVAEKAEKRIAEKEKELEQKKQQEKNRQIIEERYEKGIENVVQKYGLDFAGNEEHQQMLDDIERHAQNIRDPQNPQVIHPNAIEMATRQVMEDRGMDLRSSQETESTPDQEQQANIADKNQFNRGANANKSKNEPQTISERLRERRRQDYKQRVEKRPERRMMK